MVPWTKLGVSTQYTVHTMYKMLCSSHCHANLKFQLMLFFTAYFLFVLCGVVMRFGYWVCGESWHAIKVLKAGHLVSCLCVSVCVRVYVCVCICGGGFVCGGLSGGGVLSLL